jgi:hypothetical protein
MLSNSTGLLAFARLTPNEAREIVNIAPQVISAVGHESTAKLFSLLLGREVPVNRTEIKLNRGDAVMVLQLRKRLQEGQVIKTLEELEAIGYDLWIVYVL